MKENPSPRPSPLSAAVRVKDMAVDLAGDLAKEYRKSSRHDRLRGAIIGSWALLALVTVCVAFSSPGTNSLKAFAQQQHGGLLGTQISVDNRSGKPWTDVTLTLDDGWRYQTSTVRDQLVVAASRFSKDGVSAPEGLVPRTITIECAQGSATLSLSSRSP
jgi:hypothetical protein